MFNTIEELVQLSQEYPSVAEMMIAVEMETSGADRQMIIEHMTKNKNVMLQSIAKGTAGVTSVTGLTGGDAKRMHEYIEKGETLSQPTILKAVRNAIAVNEVNAQMGLICANPTAGSAGVVAGVLAAITEEKI